MTSSERGTAPEFRDRVQAALDAFLDEQAERLAPLGPDAARLLDEARASVSGGKRFRAAFCYWGYRAVAPRAGPTTRTRWSAPAPRWSCCTPAPWSTTT